MVTIPGLSTLNKVSQFFSGASSVQSAAGGPDIHLEKHNEYSFERSSHLFSNQKSAYKLDACFDIDNLREIIIHAHNQVKGEHDSPLETDIRFPALEKAVEALGGAEAVFGFNKSEGLWQKIKDCASQVDVLFPEHTIPTLSQDQGNAEFSLSRDQITCIMANSFLCNLPYLKLPSSTQPLTTSNFSNQSLPHYGSLSWHTTYRTRSPVGAERVKGLLLYLQQALIHPKTADTETTPVTFRRVKLDRNVDLTEQLQHIQDRPLANVKFAKGNVEDQQDATVLVDFANENLHIGAIWPSATQEEILFSLYPEAFAGILFCETMAEGDALQISGLERFVSSSGFRNTFEVQGPYQSNPNGDQSLKTITAMDASVTRRLPEQLSTKMLDRDILKAVAGFNGLSGHKIATGNWGCGVFGGNINVKFLQQLIAATVNESELIYCHSNNSDAVAKDLDCLYKGLVENNASALDIYNFLKTLSSETDPSALRDAMLRQWPSTVS